MAQTNHSADARRHATAVAQWDDEGGAGPSRVPGAMHLDTKRRSSNPTPPVRPNVQAAREIHEAAERSIAQAKDAFQRMKSATEAASGIFDDTLQAAHPHGVAMALKAVELAKANADASFDFLKAYIAATTIADAGRIETDYAQKQLDTANAQLKDARDADKAAVNVASGSRAAGKKGKPK